MVKYLQEIDSWCLQVSALKEVYGDRNVTVHFTRDFANPGELYKDGKHLTSPMYYLLNEKSTQRLSEYLIGKYPDKVLQTEAVIQQIREKVVSPTRHQEAEKVDTKEVTTDSSAVIASPATYEQIMLALQQIEKSSKATDATEVIMPAPIPTEEERFKKRRLKQYDPNRSFEDEYSWVPAVFNALYFITSPIVAALGALFFYSQISSVWVFAAVATAFALLELVFRRTIVRKCVSSLMRRRYQFGSICLIIALGISAWSIIALWNGAGQINDYKGRILKQSSADAEANAISDSLTVWRAQQKELDGKWGVSLHISKDLTKRIQEGEKQLKELKLQNDSQSSSKIAIWRYFFLLIEVIVLISLILPVWYDVRCVLLQIGA